MTKKPEPPVELQSIGVRLSKEDVEFIRAEFPWNISAGIRYIIGEYRRKEQQGGEK